MIRRSVSIVTFIDFICVKNVTSIFSSHPVAASAVTTLQPTTLNVQKYHMLIISNQIQRGKCSNDVMCQTWTSQTNLKQWSRSLAVSSLIPINPSFPHPRYTHPYKCTEHRCVSRNHARISVPSGTFRLWSDSAQLERDSILCKQNLNETRLQQGSLFALMLLSSTLFC